MNVLLGLSVYIKQVLVCRCVQTVHVVKNLLDLFHFKMHLEVKSMQRSGTEAIRTQIQPSKPKPEITKIITNSQNTNRTLLSTE